MRYHARTTPTDRVRKGAKETDAEPDTGGREVDETACVGGEEWCPGPGAADDEGADLSCWECFRRGRSA